MDSEILNLALSVLSAIVAVSSAVFAYRTRSQSRKDIFETQRDVLLLTAAQNDARLKTTELKLELLISRLQIALSMNDPGTSDNAAQILNGLREVERIYAGLRRRDWTADQIRSMDYSESALLQFRSLSLEEQVTSKTLQVEAHALLLNEGEALLSKLASAAQLKR